MKKSKREVFDPNTIPELLTKAQGGDLVARDLLLYMFQRLIATLVNVCLTGKVNPFSSYQKSFLRLFASKDKKLQDIAGMLKNRLTIFNKEELFTMGQVAVLRAIDSCEKNLASTIVYRFKEEIAYALDEGEPTTHTEYDTIQQSVYIENDILFSLFLDSLSPQHRDIVEHIIQGEKHYEDGTKVKIPTDLKRKLAEYLTA